MSRSNNRRPQPGSLYGVITMWVGIVLGTAVLSIAWISVKIGHALAGLPDTPNDPFSLFFGVLGGAIAWPRQSSVIALTLTVIFLLICGVVGWRWRRTHVFAGSRIDDSARWLGQGRDIAPLSKTAALAFAKRHHITSPGVFLGVTVAGNRELWATWEDMHLDIWGPRTGKTTSRAIPALIDAPGAVIATSNKRDLVDATRDVRDQVGRVWVFDPQKVAGESPTWWWNPLGGIYDEADAVKLADHFAYSSRPGGGKTDAFFDNAGRDLLAGLILAAALDQRPITDVYRWITRPANDEPVQILHDNDFVLQADLVQGVINSPERQRGGVYGTAAQMVACLTNRAITTWVTPQEDRPQFHPAEFVQGTGTLYSLSREGQGSSGPLVAALTVAVIEAAERAASTSPGGRLPVPILGVLDEAANVCRWRDLPDLYSHYGSRGIVLMTFLQSWSQGAQVWGEEGMTKLWSAANVRVFGGGVTEAKFLADLSGLVGDFDALQRSKSSSKTGVQISTQLHRERILDPADLAALPKGRALVLASGARPTLMRTLPWMQGSHAKQIAASIAAHDPAVMQVAHE